MKFNALTKHLSASVIILGMTVACNSTPEKEEVEEAPAASTAESTSSGPTAEQQAAKSAAESSISAASKSLVTSKGAHAEWRDTGKMIKAANKALAAGDYAKAKSLADAATAQNEYSVYQAGVEDGKFEAATDFDAVVEKPTSATTTGLATSHTVVTGDSLWGISSSSNVYDDPYKWPLIYKENAAKINDPDLIFPGQNFDINQNALSAETEAAISHARNRGAWSIGATEQSDTDYLSK